MKIAKWCYLCQLLGAATILYSEGLTEGGTIINQGGAIRKTCSINCQAFTDGRWEKSTIESVCENPSDSNGTSTIVVAETKSAETKSAESKRAESKSAETRRLLEVLDSVSIDTANLIDLERHLNERLPHGCLIDQKGLEEAGIDSALVSCQWSLSNASLGTMLELVLEKAELDYRIQDGILVITTEEIAQEHLELVVYDAAVIFESVVVVEPHMVEDRLVRELINRRLIGEQIGNLDSFREALDKYVEKFGPRADELRYNRVCELIESLVDPDSWENNGGVASLSSIGTRVIVRQTERAHRKIRKLLDSLVATNDE